MTINYYLLLRRNGFLETVIFAGTKLGAAAFFKNKGSRKIKIFFFKRKRKSQFF